MHYGTDAPADTPAEYGRKVIGAVLDNFGVIKNINIKDNDRNLSISTFDEAFGLISYDG